jgi:hypothetical protein
LAINGKVQKMRFSNTNNVEDVVTGLPVSKIDHAVSIPCHTDLLLFESAFLTTFTPRCFIAFALQINGIYFGKLAGTPSFF